MSSEVKEKVLNQKKVEPLLSKRRKKILVDPLDDNNPVTIQVLGICSALAVTIKLEPTIVMSLSVVFVMIFSSLITSLVRDYIPTRVRIIVQLAIIASLVTIVSEFLQAFNYEMYKVLGAFVGLIITNCIILGRLEAYAMGNKPYDSILDALGSSVGYAWIILTVSFFRELLGSGSVLGFKVFELIGWSNFPTNGLFVDSIGAFIILGILIWIQRSRNGYIEN